MSLLEVPASESVVLQSGQAEPPRSKTEKVHRRQNVCRHPGHRVGDTFASQQIEQSISVSMFIADGGITVTGEIGASANTSGQNVGDSLRNWATSVEFACQTCGEKPARVDLNRDRRSIARSFFRVLRPCVGADGKRERGNAREPIWPFTTPRDTQVSFSHTPHHSLLRPRRRAAPPPCRIAWMDVWCFQRRSTCPLNSQTTVQNALHPVPGLHQPR